MIPLRARGIVKQFYKRHSLYYRVIDELKADETLDIARIGISL